MFGNLGMTELIVVLFIVLLLFGARRLPEIGGSLGKGIREFKGSLKEVGGDLKEIGTDSTADGVSQEESQKEAQPQD